MLQLDNLSLKYGSFQALNGVSLHAKQGELVVLLGANGAGKSSIFRALSGLTPISGGDIVLGDTSLKGMKPWPAVGSTDFCANIDGGNKIAADSHRRAIERAHGAVGQRDHRLGRIAIDQRRDRQHVAGIEKAQNLAAAVVEQHITHRHAALQDEEFGLRIVFAHEDGTATQVARAVLQPR